jgi:hypothetical protein
MVTRASGELRSKAETFSNATLPPPTTKVFKRSNRKKTGNKVFDI